MSRGGRVPVFVVLDIDNTLLSTCRRFSASHPFAVSGALVRQQTLCYHDAERGRCVHDCTFTMRPHVPEFLRVVSGALSTSRVAVRVGLFTRNTPSYAHAVAEQLLRPLMPVPLAFALGSSRCCGPDGRQKSVSVTGAPATSLLVDDKCGSLVPREFFSGRGALVQPFFTGVRQWGPEEEMDDVLSCGERFATPEIDSNNSSSRKDDDDDDDVVESCLLGCGADAEVTLCALIEAFVAFWHDNGNEVSASGETDLLQHPRATRYRACWSSYHAPVEERLACIT
ncbi:hypothetical protein DQ04_03061030 [Trypanosoma grayi]|uniref:hypothetical protein n=1 Tax=Trypanosoma grayi TaxID=71804 RepID=UPI0004F3FE71|nr:hypothetical protein DQ04_03061030 [Trypanosoma grayi]KEG11008.1 hypothetical protein DQ04_03061030 [Trypanosoma grayi]